MSRIPFRYYAVMLLAVVVATGVLAQDRKPRVQQFPQGQSRVWSDDTGNAQVTQKVRAVRRLMNAEDFRGAAALLETIYVERPNDELLYNLLRDCYERLQEFDRLTMLIDGWIATHPGVFRHRIELARAHVMMEAHEAAGNDYRSALPLARSDRELLSVVEGFVGAGLESEALRLIDSLVPLFKKPATLMIQRGAIYEKRKEYAQAAREYMAVLGDTTRLASEAEKKILDLLQFEESSDAVEQALMLPADSIYSVRALKLLSNHYLSKNSFSQAFEFALRQDQLEGANGETLARYMRSCRDRRQYAEAARTGEYILQHYGDTPTMVRVLFMLAEVQIELGEYHKAIAAYDTIMVRSPQSRDKSDALCKIGTVLLEFLNDPIRAEAYFDSVGQYYKRGIGYLQSLQRRPYCPLRRGELDRAAAMFRKLLELRMTEEALEEASYQLGLIDFCKGQFDSAEVAFMKLTIDYPRGYYVNDALELQMILDRADGDTALLAGFARATLFEVRRMSDSVKAAYNEVVEAPNNALADIALWRLTRICLREADTASALEHIERLAEDLPESYYLPYGLKIKADLYVQDEQTRAEAREIYRLLLEEFSDYPFGSEVRQRLRELMADIPIG